jgi:hypothetical protein
VVAWIAALLTIGPSGCAQLQHSWRDRAGLDRFSETAPATGMPSNPADPDPYAARVGLNDRAPGRSWNPVDGRSVAPVARPQPMASASVPVPSPPPPPESAPSARPPVDPVPPPVPIAVAPPAEPIVARSNGDEPPPSPAGDLETIEALIDRGISRLESFRNYRVSLTRQERVRESLQPVETVTLNVRTEPFAVRLEWPEGPNKGREVLYSEAECNGLMHVKMAKTLIPIPPMQLEPTSPIALSNARHPITEAGLLHILTQTRAQLVASRAGDPAIGEFTRLGPHSAEGFATPCVEILRETPEGEHWRLLVDGESAIPVLLEASAADGQLLERYVFRDLQMDLDDLDEPGAFDPSSRFNRTLARSNPSGSDSPGESR